MTYRRLLEGGQINREIGSVQPILEDSDQDEEDAESAKTKRLRARRDNHLSVKTASRPPKTASTRKRRKTDKPVSETSFDLANPFQYTDEINRLKKKLRNESADIQIEELINGIVALKIMEMGQTEKRPFLECVPLQEDVAGTEWKIVEGVLREVKL